jgi:hypothetical protein
VENEVDRLAVLSDVNLLSNEFLVLLEKLGAELDISGFLGIEVSILWIKRDGFEGGELRRLRERCLYSEVIYQYLSHMQITRGITYRIQQQC